MLFARKPTGASHITSKNRDHSKHRRMSYNFLAFLRETLPNVEGQDSMHIGGGIQTPLPMFNFEAESQFEDAARSCSSMCSAASTVASALSSIEASMSFPSTASTLSFDLATNVAKRLSESGESYSACTRPCAPHRPTRSCHEKRSHPYERRSEKFAGMPSESKRASNFNADFLVIEGHYSSE